MDTDYIGKVVLGAWRETKDSFGWNKKTVATALLGASGLITLVVRSGLAKAMPPMIDMAWVIVTPIGAAFILFVWNLIEVQAKLYSELSAQYARLSQQVETHLAPNYDAIKLHGQYTLGAAANLWCNRNPNAIMLHDAYAWLEAFRGAVQRGELKIIPRHAETWRQRVEQENPDDRTVARREEWQRYAQSIGGVPRFLQDN